MSIAALYVVECDGLNCDCPAFTTTTDEPNEARRQAAEAGWFIVKTGEGDTDWGPAHIGLKKLKEN